MFIYFIIFQPLSEIVCKIKLLLRDKAVKKKNVVFALVYDIQF